MKTDAAKKLFRFYPVEPDRLKIAYIKSGFGERAFMAKAIWSESHLEQRLLGTKAVYIENRARYFKGKPER